MPFEVVADLDRSFWVQQDGLTWARLSIGLVLHFESLYCFMALRDTLNGSLG